MSYLTNNIDRIKTRPCDYMLALRDAIDSGSTRKIALAIHRHPASKLAPWERRARLFRLANGALPSASEADDVREQALTLVEVEEAMA